MGFFSFLGKKINEFDYKVRFLKSSVARQLFERIITYMGYTQYEFNNSEWITRRVQESFSLLVSRGLSYKLGDELAKSMAAIDINKEFLAICACDYKFQVQFEHDIFMVFGIENRHRFGLGML